MIYFEKRKFKRILSRLDKALVLLMLFIIVSAITYLLTSNPTITTIFSISLTFILALIFIVSSFRSARTQNDEQEVSDLKENYKNQIMQNSQTTFLTFVCDCLRQLPSFSSMNQRKKHGVCFYKGTYTLIRVLHPSDTYNTIEVIWRFAHQMSVLNITHGILVSAIPLDQKHYRAAKQISHCHIALFNLDEIINAKIHLENNQPYSYNFFASDSDNQPQKSTRSHNAIMFFMYAFVILISAFVVGPSMLRLFYAILAILCGFLGLGIALGPSRSKKIGKHTKS